MATVKEINHDSSTTLSDFYSTIFDPDGAYTVTPTAALNGSTNGVEADYDAGTQNARIEEGYTTSANEFRWRFRIDLDGITNSSSSSSLCNIDLTDAGTPIIEFTVVGDGGSDFELKCDYKSDSLGLTQVGSNIALPSGDTCIECRMVKETSDGDADGQVEFYINGVSQGSISNGDNFNSFAIDETLFKIFSNVAAFTGTLKYDEFILDDDNTVNLGCGFSGYDLVLGGGQP